MSTQLTGQVTAEQIAAWKDAHKANGIYSVVIDGHIGYFKNPDRKIMNAAMSKANGEAALDMFEVLAENTHIGGSKELLTDDQMFLGLSEVLKEKMAGKKAEVVNL